MVLGSFTVLWLLFFLKWRNLKLSIGQLIGVGMLLRLVYLVAIPELSDDVFRYIWDGFMSLEGSNPYELTPRQLLEQVKTMRFQELAPMLNSPDYYSIYPPVMQFFFWISVRFGGPDVEGSIVAFRILALAAEFGSMFLIWKLLRSWKMSTQNLMLYALNPLVIVEFIGSLHSEVFMVFFLLLSLWLLSEKKNWLSAVAFGLAVCTKLLPLMFLPFYIKRLGWLKAFAFGAVSFIIAGILFIPFWTPNLLANFSTSLKLYFANFEFNASIYYLVREVGFWFKGYNIIGETAVWLPRIVLVSIIALATFSKERTIVSLPKMMLFTWCIYYAFATTVHPWYITVLAAFLPFVSYRFGLIWLVLIPLSYHAYGNTNYLENPWFVLLEYVPVYVLLPVELFGANLLKRKKA
jgi:hypothetical protein